jgi:hypothetical protein
MFIIPVSAERKRQLLYQQSWYVHDMILANIYLYMFKKHICKHKFVFCVKMFVIITFELVGGYDCHCPAFWNGINCDHFDENFNGGIGHEPTEAPTTPTRLDIERQKCRENQCVEKSTNGKCDVRNILLFTLLSI